MPRLGVAGVTESGGFMCLGVLTDVSTGCGVGPVHAAGVLGSGSCGVTMGAGMVTRVARSSWIDLVGNWSL